jgi:hypothetical protein
MKILLKNHGMNLSGVKSNLYTAIGASNQKNFYFTEEFLIIDAGLDSKHSSGIPSTVSM